MPRDIDALTSATLKHLRERWWDPSFTTFLRDTLHPRPGKRILDVGCGTGTGEVELGLLGLPQVGLFGVDLIAARAREARAATRARNVRASFAAADGEALPFRDASFDATFCVAVLQHIRDVDRAVSELARVTRPGGRVLTVEPDTSARYWYSSVEAGARAFEVGTRFFTALAEARGDRTEPALGPKMPERFARHGVEPLAVQLFPVSVSRLGAPAPASWEGRRQAVTRAIELAPDTTTRRLGTEYLQALERYAAAAAAAGPAFVEIQNTTLFATVGQRGE